ncbi:MAG: Radical domain protein [Lachnospiraceae bacterium]|jgi:radical SAM protein with 4Fe4S-binding SPASM domain|nr:Radical domain protein [Lachnospiraceae bacterium]
METKNVKRVPLNGTLELTARCNLRCKMCLIRVNEKRMTELGGRERTTKEWIQLAREMFDAGTIGLLLTGGEPMLRGDFCQIYKAVAQMGFLLTLYTNATLVTPEVMEVLKAYPPHSIGITTYGASPETYEKVTGSASAYNKMIEGVRQLRQLPSKLTIRTTLIKDNANDLRKMSEWAFSIGRDVDFNVSRIVTKAVRGGIAEVESCRLTAEENVAMLRERSKEFIMEPFSRFIKEHPEVIKKEKIKKEKIPTTIFKNTDNNITDPKDQTVKEKLTLYGCEAGMSAYTITWDGKLIGCQMLGDCWTYPFETGFMQAWEDYPKQVNLQPMPEQCKGCEITCSACPATRQAETGSIGGFPEYLCQESKLAHAMEMKMIAEMQQFIEEKGRLEYETI